MKTMRKMPQFLLYVFLIDITQRQHKKLSDRELHAAQNDLHPTDFIPSSNSSAFYHTFKEDDWSLRHFQ